MPGLRHLRLLIADQRRAQRNRLALAAASAALATTAAILLLGVSADFVTGAALAGLAGLGVAQTFHGLAPSLLALSRGALRYVERVNSHEAALKALAALRPVVFEDMASAPPDEGLALSSGEASARLVQDVDALQTLFVRLSGPWGASAGSVAAVAIAGLAGPWAAAVVGASIGVSVVGALAIARRSIDTAGCQVQIATGRLKDRLGSLQAAAPEVRAYALQAWAAQAAEAAAAPLDRATTRVGLGAGWMSTWQTIVVALSVPAVFAAASDRPAPLLAAAVMAAVASTEAATALTLHFRSAGAARQAVVRLGALLSGPRQPPRRAPRTGDPLALGFLSIGLTVAPPRRLAITGGTGAGKTTLLERLMGLRGASNPDLTVGGSRPHDLDRDALRARFTYAAQEVRLLDGTVASNLRIADPGASDAALWRVLEDVDLADRIRRSSLALDTPLTNNGSALSGGERRRLALARAYLREAPWLVLDEPTEGLDAACEARVVERLRLRLDRTGQGLILISHRSAPHALCDTMIGMNGRGPDGAITLTGIARAHAAA